jgi:hypothetical protein
MRFLIMHKVDTHMEAGGPPSQAIVQGMGALVQESLKNGVFLNGAGLHRSARRARLAWSGGECTVTNGPYPGQNELVAACVMISARSMDAAVAHARALGSALGQAEIEVGPVVEPWDLGLLPKAEGNLPERFLLLCKAQAEDERGVGAPKKYRAAFEKFAESLQGEGALLAAESLAPSSKGARLGAAVKGKRSWVDGPFAESKELVAGFSLLSLPTRQEALAWADRYATILGDNEVDLREVNEP